METSVQFEATMKGAGCIKIDGDKSALLKLKIPASGADAMTSVSKYFTECDLKFSVSKSEEERVEFHASIQGDGCVKVNSDKSMAMKVVVPASEIDAMTQLWKDFSECGLQVMIERV